MPDGDSGLGPAFEFDLLAASIRADARDLSSFLEALAVKLEGALPGSVEVDREGGLFKRSHAVKAMRVSLDDRVYALSRVGAGLESRVAHSVRGVTLKNDLLALDAWIEALSRHLAEHARGSAQARAALERLIR